MFFNAKTVRAFLPTLSPTNHFCSRPRRFFSPLAVHARVFPATLHHYRRAPSRPNLFDRRHETGDDIHDDGVEVAADGLVYPKTKPEDTPVPEELILVHEHLAWFSLQPSRGMPLHELNRALDEFFTRAAHKESVESWLAAHAFEEASDNAAAAWKDV